MENTTINIIHIKFNKPTLVLPENFGGLKDNVAFNVHREQSDQPSFYVHAKYQYIIKKFEPNLDTSYLLFNGRGQFEIYTTDSDLKDNEPSKKEKELFAALLITMNGYCISQVQEASKQDLSKPMPLPKIISWEQAIDKINNFDVIL